MAFGVKFRPPTVPIGPGQCTSAAVAVEASAQAKPGPIPVTVILKKGPALTTAVPPTPVVCDGLTIAAADAADAAPDAADAAPAPKRQRTQGPGGDGAAAAASEQDGG